MANYNNNNTRANKDKDAKTNTFILSNIEKGRFLACGFWNRTLSLDFGSNNGSVVPDWKTLFDFKPTHQVLTYDPIFELADICEEVLTSIQNKGGFSSTSIRCGAGREHMIEISNGKNINMDPGIYLVLYKNADPVTMLTNPNSVEVYPFRHTTVYREYNHLTGKAQEELIPTGQFKKFVKFVREGAKAFTMAHAHAANESVRFEKAQNYFVLSQIAAANGINMMLPGGGGRVQYSNNNDGGYQRSANTGNGGGNRGGGSWQNRTATVFENDFDNVDISLSGMPTQVPMGQFQ